MLRVAATLAPAIPADDASELAAELLALLEGLSAAAATAAAMLNALVALCHAKAPNADGAAAMCGAWAKQLLTNAEACLQEYAFEGNMQDVNRVERALHMVGDIAMLGFSADDSVRVRVRVAVNGP